MKKILLTGVSGQVGWELQRTLAPLGQVVSLNSQKLNLENPETIRQIVREIKPHIIVNPAAYTAVDLAEIQKDLCFAINAHAPGILAEEAKRLKSFLIHYSTDYVFDGKSTSPYTEEQPTNPINTYGQSKLKGEQAIQEVGCNHLILRTSWVYGMRGKNFLLTMLKLAKDKDQLRIVFDQVGAPTWSRMIAQATAQMLAVCIADPDRLAELTGIYHLVARGQTNWSEFAEAIFLLNKENHPDAKIPRVTKIKTSEYPTPALRPLNSILSQDKLKSNFGLVMPHWHDALKLCLS